MALVNSFRKLLVGLTPPLLYPPILSIVNSKFVAQVLQKSGKSFYNPVWHEIPSGKLKGVRLFIDGTSGEWERSMTDGTYDVYFLKFLEGINLKGKTFFDVGAHIGYSSLVVSKLAAGKAKIAAFEPNEFNRERLNLHIQENGKIGSAISVYPIALSDKNGNQEFVFTNNVDGWTSSGSFLAAAHTRLDHDVYEKELGFKRALVPTMTLDAFAQKEKLTPDVIKIDVEGAEHLVLQGAIRTLGKHHPVILMELHSIFATVESLGILSSQGYSITVLFEDPDGRVFIAATSSKK